MTMLGKAAGLRVRLVMAPDPITLNQRANGALVELGNAPVLAIEHRETSVMIVYQVDPDRAKLESLEAARRQLREQRVTAINAAWATAPAPANPSSFDWCGPLIDCDIDVGATERRRKEDREGPVWLILQDGTELWWVSGKEGGRGHWEVADY